MSDGTLSPGELVSLAAKEGFGAIALTDHDTIEGLASAQAACREQGLLFVPGVELSTGGDREIHILGYGVSGEGALERRLAALREEREERVPRMLEKLRAAGAVLREEDVFRIANGAPPGRPHVARALVEAGYASGVKEAFTRWIGDKRPGYVPRRAMAAREAIDCIHEAGGVAIIAHPVLISCERRMLTQLLSELLSEGADGIEVYHSAHTPTDAAELLSFAKRHTALVTGGSDFHGGSKGVALGAGLSAWRDPETDFYALVQKIGEK